MVEEACTCEDGLGVPHSHVRRPIIVGNHWQMIHTGELQIWVDWRAAYKALGNDGEADA